VTAVQSPTPATAKPRLAGRDLIVLAIPAVVGALLCAIELNTRSLWLDEGSTFAIASQHGAALWRGIAHDGGNMLLYYLLIHVVISLFGSAAWVLRLPSLVATGVTGALVAALGLRLLGDRRQAVAVGLLTVVSLPMIYWGQNARGYALMVMFATASMLAFAILLERPSRGAIIAYGLCNLGMLYVGYDAALLILAQLALLPFFRERIRVVVGSLAVVAVLCIPLLVLAAQRGSGQLFWVPSLGGSVLGQTALTLLSAALPPNFHHTSTTTATWIVMAIALAATLVAAVLELRRSADRRAHWKLWLLVAWLVIPATIGLLASLAGEPIELARCAILLIPAISLLTVWAIVRLAPNPAAGAVVLAVLLALRLLQVIPAYGVSSEDWKGAAAYVARSTVGQRACVAFYPQDGRESFDYYVRGSAAARRLTPVLPALDWSTVKPFVERYGSFTAADLRAVGGCSRLILIASHQGSSSGTAVSRANWARYVAIQHALDKRFASHTVRKFGWASTVTVTSYSRRYDALRVSARSRRR